MSNKRRAHAQLDPIIHPLPRLRLCAILAPLDWEEFQTLRDLLKTSDSALSKQLSALTEAGYVEQLRASRGGRSRVRVHLTAAGRRAFRAHLAALAALAQSE
ncbi:transcriptional regulator [Agrococcus casei]|uniref:transcriptional regulator n=1 Tax=Agrococcus casei TaxID=343512 RepID=UPI000B353281|nr:transcriptional regulator [Agrococcus casei]